MTRTSTSTPRDTRSWKEGLLLHLEESPQGRVALLDTQGDDELFGLLAIYKSGPKFEAVAVDMNGRERPDLAERLTRRPLKTRRVKADTWTGQAGWSKLIRSLGELIDSRGRPVALAAFHIGP